LLQQALPCVLLTAFAQLIPQISELMTKLSESFYRSWVRNRCSRDSRLADWLIWEASHRLDNFSFWFAAWMEIRRAPGARAGAMKVSVAGRADTIRRFGYTCTGDHSNERGGSCRSKWHFRWFFAGLE
jgi:hypothetical protein